MWRARTSLARAAPWALATTWSRSSCSPAGLALAARTTTSLLKLETAQFQGEPRVVAKNFKLVLAGTALGALISSEADCAPKKKAKTNSKPAAAKKPGPALTAIEKALEPEKVYNVEKLLASRLAGGVKQYLVRWEGYDSKHDSWEPMQNLSNLVAEMAAFDLRKEKANQDHLDELAKQKAERAAARESAGNGGAGETDDPDEKDEKEEEPGVAWDKKKARCYEVFKPSEDKPKTHAICISTEGARMARQYHNEPATSAGAERLFSAASRAHHDLKGSMSDNSLEHELLALANTD